MNKVSDILVSDKYLNGQFFGDGVVRKTVLSRCKKCNSSRGVITLKIIPANRTDPFWPKYIPQFKQSCQGCGKYLKFVVQTSEFINKFNQKLQEVVING